MSIYFALEYDANGVSRIVEKKDTSTRAITQRDFNFGSYVGNQITSPEDPNQPVEDNTTDDFISQMGTGTMGNNDEMDSFQRFIDRSNLTAFMNEGKGPKDTKFINAIFAALGVPVTAEGITKFFDNISKFLPQESPEVRRIRKFYATRGAEGGLRFMDPSSPDYIPGLENYNIVYGDPRDPDSGLQNVITKRMSTIANTLSNASYMSKYGLDRGLTSKEIQAIIDGTYAGPETPLTKRYKNLNDVASLEFNFKYDDVAKTDKVDTVDFKDKPDFGKDTGEGFDITDPNVPTGIVEDTEGSGEFSTPQRQRDLSGSDKKDFGPYQDRAKAAAETRSRDLSNMRGGVGRNNNNRGGGGFGAADFGPAEGEFSGL